MKVKPFDDFIKENNLSNTDPKLIKCINNDRGGYVLQIGTKEPTKFTMWDLTTFGCTLGRM